MMRTLASMLAGVVLLGLVSGAGASTLMRYPTTSAAEIVFVAHDDLWAAPLAGGVARRLTHDPGAVSTPMFSPDGRWIAFTSRRGGLRDVYVLPAAGGEPRRLTFEGSSYGEGALVVAWTPDSRRVIYLSHRDAPVMKLVRACSVAVEGGAAELLPLDHAGMMSYAPDGHTIIFNRIFRNLELRKRYIGGQAQDLYSYDFGTRRMSRLTSWKGTDTSPMVYRRSLYFVSDRGPGFRANIWRYSLDHHVFSQVTHFTDYDVDWPSLGGSTITFQQGGHLFAIDLPGERLRQINVDVPDDGERTATHSVAVGQAVRVKDAMGGVDYALSPTGSALLISARGDLFRVTPRAPGQDLTNTPGVDEDHPAWSPDAKSIAYETDSTGSQQIAIRAVEGGAERVLTNFSAGYFYTPIWSPQGTSLIVADANHELWWIQTNQLPPQRIAADPYAEIRDAAFSPDGRWLAYSTQRATGLRAIHLHELASGSDTIVSSPMESDRSPVFTPDGSLLVFISQRNEQPFVSDRDDENIVATINSDGLYAATLNYHSASPLTGPAKPASSFHIDLQNLMQRAVALPVTPAVIASLQVRGQNVFYQTQPVQLIGGDLAGETGALRLLDLTNMKSRNVIENLSSYSLSADGSTVAYRQNGTWRVGPTVTPSSALTGLEGEAIDLSHLMISIDPRREWVEMFENAWRLDRDIFFSKVMNGSNWQAVYDAYVKLLPFVGSQDDFLYLLGQMQGEIASSHTFMGRGVDSDTRHGLSTGLLGADYALDTKTGRYRFARIYRGDQSRPSMAGPLGVPGLDVRDGDYLLAIHGQELRAPQTPDSLLSGVEGVTTLTLADSPKGVRRDVTVHLIDDDMEIRRLAWIADNREAVTKLSGDRLGYIFLSDFADEGSQDFVRQFYAQRDKAGLIFDVRWNLGGFTSQAVLDVLRRVRAGIFVNREGAVAPLPSATAPPVMVTLINYASASDGDQFPYFFRRFGLGKLVGERTWGGVQGINGPWRLMDGSFITIPKDSLATTDGKWIIENEGVAPDVAIATEPGEACKGIDSQLKAAVQVGVQQLAHTPSRTPEAPALLPAYPPAGNVPGASFPH